MIDKINAAKAIIATITIKIIVPVFDFSGVDYLLGDDIFN